MLIQLLLENRGQAYIKSNNPFIIALLVLLVKRNMVSP